mgnify:CR=1 FL=1
MVILHFSLVNQVIMTPRNSKLCGKFFAKPSVAAVHITEGDLQVGDSIKFSGHTTEFTELIQSMEVDNKPVQKAVAGDSIGLKVSDRVRPGDEVFKIVAE